jgi:hypothetical protein
VAALAKKRARPARSVDIIDMFFVRCEFRACRVSSLGPPRRYFLAERVAECLPFTFPLEAQCRVGLRTPLFATPPRRPYFASALSRARRRWLWSSPIPPRGATSTGTKGQRHSAAPEATAGAVRLVFGAGKHTSTRATTSRHEYCPHEGPPARSRTPWYSSIHCAKK